MAKGRKNWGKRDGGWPKLIVAIDTLFLSRKFRHTGTGVYLYNVLSECLKIARAGERNYEFHGFMDPNDDWASNGFVSPFLRVHKTRLMAQRRLWLLGGMSMRTARVLPDLVFLPSTQSALPSPFCLLLET